MPSSTDFGMVKGKGAAGKEKENGKAKTKAKSVNYLIRQDSPLPPLFPRKGKHKARIRKAKEFPNAPMGEFICSIKKHPPPPPRLPDRTGAGVRAAEAAASGSKLPHVSHVLHDEEKEEDAEDEDKEYDEQNLFVVPPLQGGGDMSDDDTSDGYKESADELEGSDTMSEELLVHVVSSEDSEEEARERKKKNNKRPRANALVRTISNVWAHFHKVKEPSLKNPGQIVLKACCNYCPNKYAYEKGGSTSTIGRHHLKCLNYKAKMARAAIQTTLELRKTNDAYRSSLKPVMVEALVCAASYIKGAHVDLNMVPRDENEEDDVETIKLPVVEEIND
ncbi:zinc finger BED domain-containing protein RICESLEEPER 2-like [Hordeum vulgare]|nr:zinc finger BED domain-containing protein RICESLEEPER 2-like [Hordeum vulgare]